ncbi:hypothetical protein CFC21_024472 [Triticum aestivum]|uniref:Serpin domain-containing protein n=3 Tax=Triticum TaxID=4564 RepID=A0A9R1PTP9_TRITD|nr:putative non-inhibitory serpin-10 [Triticum aestivum]KAF7009994.1 hypothetical protein CFC21_024472 [Triticum aestivum]VAH49560.1 unnamed protein product [Triticum turgidum subsp. durum]
MDQCLQVALFAGTDAIARRSNFIFSPLSMRTGLALLATGTNGKTLSQLLAFLGSQDLHLLNAASASLIAEMRAWPQLTFAAGIFADKSFSLRPEFVSAAASAHRASVRSVDFQNQPAAAAAEVNALIAETTRGRIRDLVSPDSFRGDPKIVLANAMHFKATWARKFDPSDTVRRDFHRLDGTSVRVPFLSAPGMQYATSFDDLGFKVLQCFYKMAGRDGKLDPKAPLFSMLIFLPHRRDGLRDLLRLAVTEPDFVMRCAPRLQQVVNPCLLPKFKFSFRFDAMDALRSLGLAAPFDPLAADLSGAVSNMPREGLYVSTVEQMCAVEVDEEGTTAVAAFYAPSNPTYSPCERPPPPPMSFVADHPFLFAIVEYGKGEVLFLGHVVDPSS